MSSSFFWDGVSQAWHLIATRDHQLVELTWVTLKVAGISTAIAAVPGLPLGLLLGLGRFRGRGLLLAIANAGLALPPVLVGLGMYVFIFPKAPLGHLHLLYTLKAIYIAQTILAFPVIVALTASAARGVTPGLLDQARAFHAGRLQVAVLAMREARVGIFTAIIAEVGAVVMVGGNSIGFTRTLASALLDEVAGARYANAMAYGIVLFGLILIIAALLTFLQRGQSGRRPWLNRAS
jgi:tungstate transport system permease protein